MPFGMYRAVLNEKKKPEKTKPESRPQPVRQFSPAPAPVPQQPVKPVKETPPPVLPSVPAASPTEITVLIAARTRTAACDLAAALHIDMSPAASSAGLSFYSNDNETIQSVLRRQKMISSFFLGSGEVIYKLDDTKSGESGRYIFNLGIPGMQKRCYKVNIVCAAASELASGSLPYYDALWVLADAPLYSESSISDVFSSSVPGVIRSALGSDKPVFVIAGQIENSGKIRESGSICSIERDVYDMLSKSISRAFGLEKGSLPLLPVQIYGGLGYKETDPYGCVVLEDNRRGGMCIYKPVGCHIPLFFTIERCFSTRGASDPDILRKVISFNRKQLSEYKAGGISIGGQGYE